MGLAPAFFVGITPASSVGFTPGRLPLEVLGEALGDVELVLLSLVALACAAFFAVLRTGLLHSHPERVLDTARGEAERETLRPRLERAESLALSASIFEILSEIWFVVLVLGGIGHTSTAGGMGLALLICVPTLVFATEVLPAALRGDRSDSLLRRTLPVFDLLQRPLAALIFGLERTRDLVMRLLRIPDRPRSARRIVEGLRDVIEESDREEDLAEDERELIENVVEFYDVDVAAIMTPRTELTALSADDGVEDVVRAIAESGHSRIPIYERNLDSIIGFVYAQEILQLVARGEVEDRTLRGLCQPVAFVPETKLVSELLGEFRHEKRKAAVVLDEYGGTAGIVTVGDIVAELVGDMREELGDETPAPIRRRHDGAVDIAGTTHVTDVNEELELELPEEEDFETMAGFVLSRLGHFPKAGEALEWNGAELVVTEASDRRVLEVRLLRLPESSTAGRVREAPGGDRAPKAAPRRDVRPGGDPPRTEAQRAG